MLDTVFNTREMEFIPQLAEPAIRLHLLVVDADAAVRSACAEIAASLGYAVDSRRGRTTDWNSSPRSSCSILTLR
jgi:two-component system response regulator HydG